MTAAASLAISSPPVALGLARSSSPFDLARPKVTVDPQQVSQAVLQAGDEISARSGMVRVQLREGDNLLVSKGSRVAFPAQDEIHVMSGDIASATTLAKPSRVKASNLLFEAQGEAAEGAPSALAVSIVEANRITATAYDRVYSITDEKGVQVAALGAGDTIRLQRNAIGQWIPTGFRNQGEGGAVEEAPEAGHEEGDRRKGFWLFRTPVLIGAATAAAIGGGYYAYSSGQDDSSNDDDDDVPPRFDDSPTAPDDHHPPDDPHETDYNPPGNGQLRGSR